ncbi:2Fe-2S iron-sulfur cluster-binding protein [soil metagenome]
MQIAVNEGVRGVVAECGGALACATCHCYVEAGADALPPKHPDEEEMLAGVAAPRAANSRLSCQLTVSPSLGGLVIRFPDRQ